MNQYDNLFQTIERLTGASLLQTEMDDVVMACEPLNRIKDNTLSLENEVLLGAYETSQRQVKKLEAEKAELLEALQMAWPHIHDWEAENIEDPEVGIFRDNQLSELHDKVKGILQEQCPQIQDAQ